MSSAKFMARVWLDEELVHDIEVWVHELVPTDGKRWPASEWVREHLMEYDRQWYLDTFELKELFGEPSGFQIIFEGTIEGWFDRDGEFDEEITVGEFMYNFVPVTWFCHSILAGE